MSDEIMDKGVPEEKPAEIPAVTAPQDTISRIKDDPLVKFILKRKKQFLSGIALLFILGYAFLLRTPTFWLPHWMGDQCHYLSLAMKLDFFGFKEYSLQGVNVDFITFDDKKIFRLVYPIPSKDIHKPGMLLQGMALAGITYYNQPFFHKPPGFPFAIMLSHKIFAKNQKLYTVVFTNIGRYMWKIRPPVFFDAQFYAVIVPLLFSLGLVLLAFVIGQMLFSARAGLYGALMLAIHPTSILTSQKLWADDMLSFFVGLAFVFLILAEKRKKDIYVAIAGIMCGIAVLAKQSGGFMVFGVWFYYFITSPYRFSDLKHLPAMIFNKKTIIFAGMTVLVSAFWFIKIYRVYGNPLFLPGQSDLMNQDITGWFKFLAQRPQGLILFPVTIVALCPLFIFLFPTLKEFGWSMYAAIRKKTYGRNFLLLWVIILCFYFKVGSEREERLLLPMYPMLAALAGYGLERFRFYQGRFAKYLGSRDIREMIIMGFFVVCTLWSVPIAINAAINEVILLKVPF